MAAREQWSSRIGFIFATVGSAVGLGSIWKFPYEVGANGGGAFVLFYLAGLALIVFPLMLAEFAIGRRGRAEASEGLRRVADAAGASPRWGLIGVWGATAAFLILSFYSVIGGWAIAHAVETSFSGLPGPASDAARVRHAALLGSPARLASFHAAFMAMTAFVVARGVANGIEQACKILMPALIALLFALLIYAVVEGRLAPALRFLFAVDVAKLTPGVALQALGLGFFSIGVGLALMLTYAAYAPLDLDLREVAVATIIGDTAISFMAGLAIFPIVFAENLDPASGPGLMFETLPVAFARMPFGAVAAVGFFVLLTLAGLASAISMLEMSVALVRRRLGWTRPKAAYAAAAACWFVGLATVWSFSRGASVYPFAHIPGVSNATVFDLLDHLTSNVMLPVGGFMLAIVAGWVLPPSLLRDELGYGPRALAALIALLRYVVPAALLLLAAWNVVH